MVELLNAPAQQNVDNKEQKPPNLTETNNTENGEQLRTTAGKNKILHLLKKTPSVSLACMQVHISRWTFYNWYNNDPEFRAAVRAIAALESEWVKDLLMEKIKDRDTSSIHFYLKAKHPDFKPHLRIEPVNGNRSFEDIIDIENGNITEATTTEGEQRTGGEILLDKEQERAQGEVQTEQGPAVLPIQEEAPQHNNQSEAEGAK